jgi:hypothetical protein
MVGVEISEEEAVVDMVDAELSGWRRWQADESREMSSEIMITRDEPDELHSSPSIA